MSKEIIGIIGGSGLYEMEGLVNVEKITVETPFGNPSAELIKGTIDNLEVVFLARHGVGHSLLPSEVNYRANIFAMKKLGVTRIISISACGSLQSELEPGDLVIVDQFIDFTKKRENTFFGNGVIVHVSMADPLCTDLREKLSLVAKDRGLKVHSKGTYICIEGPHFSTRAESHMFINLGADVVGMTNATEAKLAREAEICYVSLAFVTDYDCWNIEKEAVTVEMAMAVLRKNTDKGKEIVRQSLKLIAENKTCECNDTLKYSLVTDVNNIEEEKIKEIKPLIEKYLN